MPRNPFDHRSAWTPGPITSNLRSSAQWLWALGKSSLGIATGLISMFGDYAKPVAARLGNLATAFGSKIAELMQGGAAAQIPRAQIPRNAVLPKPYRAIVNVRLRDPLAPAGSRDAAFSDHLTVILDFDYNPTLSDIRRESRQMLKDLARPEGSEKAKLLEGWKPVGFDIWGMERRS